MGEKPLAKERTVTLLALAHNPDPTRKTREQSLTLPPLIVYKYSSPHSLSTAPPPTPTPYNKPNNNTAVATGLFPNDLHTATQQPKPPFVIDHPPVSTWVSDQHHTMPAHHLPSPSSSASLSPRTQNSHPMSRQHSCSEDESDPAARSALEIRREKNRIKQRNLRRES